MEEKKKLMQMLDFADTCIKSNSDTEAISSILKKANELIPFTAATIAIDINVDFTLSSDQQISTLNLSQEWQDIYFQRKFYNKDPVLSAVSNSQMAVSWQEAYERFGSSNDYKNLSEKFVGNDGSAILVKNDSGSTLLSFVMSKGSVGTEYNQVIEYIAPHIHEVFNRSGDKQRKSLWTPHLSSRELEVLNWAKEGKSNWEISQIMAISERTVKFHLSNAFKKLNVVNRSQAIARAIHFGLVSV